jgi:hypothetical protein
MAVQEEVTVREIEKLLVRVRQVELGLGQARVLAQVRELVVAQVRELAREVAQVQAVVREVAREVAQVQAVVRVLAQVLEVARVLVINPDEIQRSLQGQPISDENRQGLKAIQIDQGMVLVLVD